MFGMTGEQFGFFLIAFSTAITALMAGNKAKQMTKAQTASPQTEKLEIAGAVIDPASAKMLADAFRTNTDAVTALNSNMVEHRKALDRNSEVCEDMRSDIREAANKMERLKDEMIRGQSQSTIPPGYMR